MKDSAKKTISIGKQAVGGGDELTGAELQLTVPKGVDLSQIEAAYGDQSTNGIVKSDKTISWKSDGTKGSVELTDLPAGTYTPERNHRTGRLYEKDRGDELRGRS